MNDAANSESNQYKFLSAAKNGDVPAIERLLTVPGVDVNEQLDGQTALYLAAANNRLDVMNRLLLVPGIDVNKSTPLLQAIRSENQDVVMRLLQDPRVNVNVRTDRGETPISLAINSGRAHMLSLLLARPDIDLAATNFGIRGVRESPLMSAVKWKSPVVDIIRMLVADPRIDVNRLETVYTPLTYAISKGSTVGVRELLNSPRIDVNQYTPLHSALLVHPINPGIIRLLLEAPGLNVNAQDDEGNTPLHIAVEKGAIDCVQLLIKANAARDIRNNAGKLAAEIAADNGFLKISRALSLLQDNAWMRRRHAVTGWTMASGKMDEIVAAKVISSVLRSVAEAAGVDLTIDLYSLAYTPAYNAYLDASEEGPIQAKAAATIAATRVISSAGAAAGGAGAGAAENQGGGRRRSSRRATKIKRRATRVRVCRYQSGLCKK